MLTERRQQLIADYVNEHGICRVAELCNLTSTSESTVRRDLSEMEEQGLLKRVHGGARSVKTSFSQDVSQHIRFNLNREEKIQIAEQAVKHVHQGDYVYLDAGTTVYETVPFLKKIPDLHVVTNGLDTALACVNAGLDTCLIGGSIKHQTHATIGSTALDKVGHLNFNVAFIGANALSKSGQLTTPDTEEAAIKRAAIMQSQNTFALVDHSKFDSVTFAEFATTDEVTVISRILTFEDKQKLPENIQLEEAE